MSLCALSSDLQSNLGARHSQGIISNADDTRDIQLIEDMVRKSVGGNTLILLTVTMKDLLSASYTCLFCMS